MKAAEYNNSRAGKKVAAVAVTVMTLASGASATPAQQFNVPTVKGACTPRSSLRQYQAPVVSNIPKHIIQPSKKNSLYMDEDEVPEKSNLEALPSIQDICDDLYWATRHGEEEVVVAIANELRRRGAQNRAVNAINSNDYFRFVEICLNHNIYFKGRQKIMIPLERGASRKRRRVRKRPEDYSYVRSLWNLKPYSRGRARAEVSCGAVLDDDWLLSFGEDEDISNDREAQSYLSSGIKKCTVEELIGGMFRESN